MTRKKMLQKLLGDKDESSSQNFSIVPIVGMGGVGKTTLARLLYDEKEVKDHFELRAWVCVSDEFNIPDISKVIYQSVTGEKKEFEDLNLLQESLKEKLQNRLFLIVLDDVWSESYGDWEKLVGPFLVGSPGSRVIMTTRKEQLLRKLGFSHQDPLRGLSQDDALSLFALHALGVNNFDSHPTLRPYGEGLVRKCGGLPLALRTLGRLLRTKANEEEWKDLLDSEIWKLGNRDEIVPALRLSYHDLSASLKLLFAYCSLFPKDYEFDKDDLVLLWKAEGFLHQSTPITSMGSLGHEYFEELLSRSFFQHVPHNKSLFVMHDLMNDLATSVARDFFSRLDIEMKKEFRKEALVKHRHMSFVCETFMGYKTFEPFKGAKSLRTLLALSIESWKIFYLSNKVLNDLLQELPLLRVLSLSDLSISIVPKFIGSLKHLRYLNLSRTKITYLPENVCNLYNLQTLIVSGCFQLIKLPESFSKLINLQHFNFRDTPCLKKMPLGIESYRGIEFPNWVGDPLFLWLTNVSIYKCEECTSLPRIGQLPSLKKLVIGMMNKVKVVGLELHGSGVAFPLLEIVHFDGMSGWEEWPTTNSGVVDAVFPCLQELSIKSCPNLVKVSLEALPSLRVLKLKKCGHGVLKSLVDVASSVSKLKINGISGLTDELWRGIIEYLGEVVQVRIKRCNEIRSLWESDAEVSKFLVNLRELKVYKFSNLTSLTYLGIHNCESMDASFPRGFWPPKLSSLVIGGLKKSISKWGPQNFPTSLVRLILFGGPYDDVRNFGQLSYLLPPSLITLGIYEFEKLESVSIGLQHLTSLQKLYMYNCPKMIDLPEMLLPSLLSLRINGCPNLKKKSSKGGSYWPLISHIPRFYIE